MGYLTTMMSGLTLRPLVRRLLRFIMTEALFSSLKLAVRPTIYAYELEGVDIKDGHVESWIHF